MLGKHNQRRWKSCIQKVNIGYTSRTEPEKFCLNMPAPSGKAKYYWETDSEQVLWRKGEKNPKKGSEKTLKPYAYKRSEPRLWRGDGVPFA